jgi:glutamate 5-kinase
VSKKPQRWVIKIGSSLLTANGAGLDIEAIQGWVRQMAHLRAEGVELVIVSSGAVAAGVQRLGLNSWPQELHKLQAAAAVGQMGLVQTWESQFQEHGAHTAQILLVNDDVANRERYLNARKTLNTLLAMGVVPIVNENDTVTTDEICFGDNDRLAALVANLVYADRLVILTDQNGLYEEDPRKNPGAQLVQSASADDVLLMKMAAGGAGELGRGGMQTKVLAARQAATSGADTHIVHGASEGILLRLYGGEPCGTQLKAMSKPTTARKQWIAGQLQTRGVLSLDDGAAEVIVKNGRSLLPVGVFALEGQFQRGDLVSCVDADGVEIARGLVSYSAEEASRIIGLSSDRVREVLNGPVDDELIHRDNLVVLAEYRSE